MHFQELETLRDRATGDVLATPAQVAGALAAAGFGVQYKRMADVAAGKVSHVWRVITDVVTANELLIRAQVPAGPESLIEREPECAFLAALTAIRNWQVMARWLRAPATVPVAVKPGAKSRLLALTFAPARPSADLMALVWDGKAPDAGQRVPVRSEEDGIFLAAAAAVGFLPYPRLLVDAGGAPVLVVLEESVTFAGLRLEHFEAAADATSPGREAFTAGVRGIAHWQRFVAHELRTAAQTYMRRSKFDPEKTAFVSAALFEENAAVRDEVEEFLTT